MRNPTRIARILGKITVYWLRNPDLRFFQMIVILESALSKIGRMNDFFYLEDDKLEYYLDQVIRE